MFPKHRLEPKASETKGAYKGYLAGLLAPALAVFAHTLLPSDFQPLYFFLLYPTVFAIAIGWGGGPGTLCATVSTLLAWYFLLPPAGSFALARPMELLPALLFLAMGLAISWLAGRFRSATRQLLESTREVREREVELRDFVENASVGLHWVGPDGTILWANKAELELLGYSREEYVGRKIHEFHVDEPVIRDLLERLIRGETLINQDAKLRAKDGSIKHVLLNSNASFEDGVFKHTRCFSRDITVRKLAEDKLRESERLLDQLFAGSPAFMTFLSLPDHRYEKSNEEHYKLVGRRDIIGKTVKELLPEIEAQGFVRLLDEVARTGEPFIGSEIPITFLNGPGGTPRNLYLDFNYQPLRRLDGEVFGIAAQGYDVTEKVLSRKAVENERENFRNLFRQTPEMVCILRGLEHVFEFVNEAHIKTLGFDATGMSVRAAQPDSVEVHGILDEVFRTGTTAELHEIPVTVTGRVRFFNLTYSARRAESGKINGIMILGVEVTDQIAARESLKDSLRARDEFLSIASHELRTPITSLRMQLQLTQRTMESRSGGQPSPERLNRAVDVSMRQVDRLTKMVEDLLEISQVRAGKLPFEFGEFDLAALVAEQVEQHRAMLEAAGCKVELEAGPPLRVDGDRLRMSQVLQNLLSNATKYGAGQPVQVTVAEDGALARVQVRDHGMGIAKDKQTRIFERFERAISHDNICGWGLGLYITRQIVDAHHGRIDVESEPGRGSVFTVEIPKRQLAGPRVDAGTVRASI